MRDQEEEEKIYHRGTEHAEKKEDAFKKPRKGVIYAICDICG